MQQILVGLGEIEVTAKDAVVLVCYGLGSCVGVALTDPIAGVSSLAHVVLPESSLGRTADFPPAKYADTAIPAVLEKMKHFGAVPDRLQARIAGGARVLKGFGMPNDRLDIGTRNIEAVKEALAAHGIKLVGEDVGGCYGRTMRLYADNGRVTVSTVGHGEKDL